ncbi:GNAT family N-acetyltransferase [Microbispora sp. ATCC PTA-5024]|uniref:GNAT family N-acetyltransferase n=1 Tax=Microbispora sp. ATCC PTA-5024 TaxID=316330 RepID=UPI0003DD645B|nr:GNAT family N-acetyltransferase [Microbispora sp. ATCC PTA-5024]ETK36058.1 N-acetyltransferase GCN5 [Microbispora sp. ATCC PTA-5024]
MTQNDLTMRPITGPEEIDLFCRLPYVLNDELADDLASGRRRPEWMWMALSGDRVVARLAWWGPREGAAPQILDILDLDDQPDRPQHPDEPSNPDQRHQNEQPHQPDRPGASERVNVGVRLLRTAMAAVLPPGAAPPEYSRFISPGWREDEAARREVSDRMTVLEHAGARLLVERRRLEWRVGTPIPPPSGRLTFRPVRDRAELVELMTLVLEDTLDAHSRAELARLPAAAVAAGHYDGELGRYPRRDWWRIGITAGGEPVGFVVPARNDYNPIIAYIGVLPAHRGRGHVDDLLAEGTRILADQGAARIRAATDVGNVPMARAFERAGYVTFQRQIDMTWS